MCQRDLWQHDTNFNLIILRTSPLSFLSIVSLNEKQENIIIWAMVFSIHCSQNKRRQWFCHTMHQAKTTCSWAPILNLKSVWQSSEQFCMYSLAVRIQKLTITGAQFLAFLRAHLPNSTEFLVIHLNNFTLKGIEGGE